MYVFNPWIFVGDTINLVFIIARIPKWTVTLAIVKMFTWNVPQCFLIFSYQIVFVRPRIDHIIAGYDKIRILSANRTSPKMLFLSPLIIRGSPIPDAFKTESVIAAFQHAKLLVISQHRLQTNLTIFIVFLDPS